MAKYMCSCVSHDLRIDRMMVLSLDGQNGGVTLHDSEPLEPVDIIGDESTYTVCNNCEIDGKLSDFIVSP